MPFADTFLVVSSSDDYELEQVLEPGAGTYDFVNWDIIEQQSNFPHTPGDEIIFPSSGAYQMIVECTTNWTNGAVDGYPRCWHTGLTNLGRFVQPNEDPYETGFPNDFIAYSLGGFSGPQGDLTVVTYDGPYDDSAFIYPSGSGGYSNCDEAYVAYQQPVGLLKVEGRWASPVFPVVAKPLRLKLFGTTWVDTGVLSLVYHATLYSGLRITFIKGSDPIPTIAPAIARFNQSDASLVWRTNTAP